MKAISSLVARYLWMVSMGLMGLNFLLLILSQLEIPPFSIRPENNWTNYTLDVVGIILIWVAILFLSFVLAVISLSIYKKYKSLPFYALWFLLSGALGIWVIKLNDPPHEGLSVYIFALLIIIYAVWTLYKMYRLYLLHRED